MAQAALGDSVATFQPNVGASPTSVPEIFPGFTRAWFLGSSEISPGQMAAFNAFEDEQVAFDFTDSSSVESTSPYAATLKRAEFDPTHNDHLRFWHTDDAGLSIYNFQMWAHQGDDLIYWPTASADPGTRYMRPGRHYRMGYDLYLSPELVNLFPLPSDKFLVFFKIQNYYDGGDFQHDPCIGHSISPGNASAGYLNGKTWWRSSIRGDSDEISGAPAEVEIDGDMLGVPLLPYPFGYRVILDTVFGTNGTGSTFLTINDIPFHTLPAITNYMHTLVANRGPRHPYFGLYLSNGGWPASGEWSIWLDNLFIDVDPATP